MIEIKASEVLSAPHGGDSLSATDVVAMTDFLVGYDRTSHGVSDLADELSVDWREVSQWRRAGCQGALAAYLRLAVRLKGHHMPWRSNEVPIRLTESGFEVGKSGSLV